MHFISASRKTDIPALYSEWFMQRIRAGYCHWTHPHTAQMQRISLMPEDCLAVVFWTRNPGPLLPHLDELTERGFKYYFFFTITGYPRSLEPYALKLGESIKSFRALSERVGPDRAFWRYDPVLLSNATPVSYHIDRFGEIAKQLAGYTRQCTYAWYLPFNHAQRNLAERQVVLRPLSDEDRHMLLSQMVKITDSHNMRLVSCFSDDCLRVPRIQMGGCIDLDILRELTGNPDLDLMPAAQFDEMLRGPQTRPSVLASLRTLAGRARRTLMAETEPSHCRCVASIDIGSPDTCVFGCAYCFATRSGEAALQNYRAHDPADSILLCPDHTRKIGGDLLLIDDHDRNRIET